jgi:hypothetical protein
MKAETSEIASLGDIYKDCLRLAIYHYSSKEIGLKLGISRHTVDQRIRLATQRLGASSRFEAARILADFEAGAGGASTPHPFTYQPPYVSKSSAADTAIGSAGERDGQADGRMSSLNDAQAPFVFQHMLDEAQTFANPVPFMGGSKRGLSLPVKALWAAGITTFSLFAFVAAIAGLEILSRIQ